MPQIRDRRRAAHPVDCQGATCEELNEDLERGIAIGPALLRAAPLGNLPPQRMVVHNLPAGVVAVPYDRPRERGGVMSERHHLCLNKLGTNSVLSRKL